MRTETLQECLFLVRRDIRRMLARAQKPAQRAKVAALTAAGRGNVVESRLRWLEAGVEDDLCQALAARNEPQQRPRPDAVEEGAA